MWKQFPMAVDWSGGQRRRLMSNKAHMAPMIFGGYAPRTLCGSSKIPSSRPLRAMLRAIVGFTLDQSELLATQACSSSGHDQSHNCGSCGPWI